MEWDGLDRSPAKAAKFIQVGCMYHFPFVYCINPGYFAFGTENRINLISSASLTEDFGVNKKFGVHADAVLGGDDLVGFGVEAQRKMVLLDVFLQIGAAQLKAQAFAHVVGNAAFGSDARFGQAISGNKHLDGFEEAEIRVVGREQGEIERDHLDLLHQVFAGVVDLESGF